MKITAAVRRAVLSFVLGVCSTLLPGSVLLPHWLAPFCFLLSWAVQVCEDGYVVDFGIVKKVTTDAKASHEGLRSFLSSFFVFSCIVSSVSAEVEIDSLNEIWCTSDAHRLELPVRYSMRVPDKT